MGWLAERLHKSTHRSKRDRVMHFRSVSGKSAVIDELSGGEGGIRTHETLITFCGFQDRRIQPLCHLSTLLERLISQ